MIAGYWWLPFITVSLPSINQYCGISAMRVVEILLVEAPHKPGNMAKVLAVIGSLDVTVEGLNAVRRLDKDTIWEITIEYDDTLKIDDLIEQINQLPETSQGFLCVALLC